MTTMLNRKKGPKNNRWSLVSINTAWDLCWNDQAGEVQLNRVGNQAPELIAIEIAINYTGKSGSRASWYAFI